MGKLFLLFVGAMALLGIGAYIKQNPAWIQKYRGSLSTTSQVSTFKPSSTSSQPKTSWPTYHSQAGRFTISYPPNWHQDTSVPGCGPTFFAPQTKQIWLTLCGPDTKVNATSLATLAQKSRRTNASITDSTTLTVAGHSAYRQTQQTSNATIYQLFIDNIPLTATGSGVVELSLTDTTSPQETSLSTTFQTIIDSLQLE